jgi:hypothetical protein
MSGRITVPHIRLAATLVAGAAAAWLLRDQLFTFLIEPIGWLLWAGWRILASIDPGVIWLILIIACIVLFVRVVPTVTVAHPDSSDESGHAPDPGDRLAHWQGRAARAMQDAAGRSAFRQNLESLALSVSVATRIPRPGSLPGASPGGYEDDSLWQPPGRQARFKEWLRRLVSADWRSEQDAIENVLDWMESSLEIKNER